MKVFTGALSKYAANFAAEGWIHIPGMVHRDFVRAALSSTGKPDHHPLPPANIGGQKSHMLFQFPPGIDYVKDFALPVSELCGLNLARFTLSQRHVMRYAADAKDMPKVHKDRFASSISIGIPLFVPQSSCLVLYPYDDSQANKFMTTELRRFLRAERLPEVSLARWRAVEITDRPGDLIAFRGSRAWHTRRNPRNAAHLYVMVNDLLLDPLSEDPAADLNRQRSLAFVTSESSDRDNTVIIQGGSSTPYRGTAIVTGRRLTPRASRPDRTVYLTESEEKVIGCLADGMQYAAVRDLIPGCGFAGRYELDVAIERLLAEGVLDIE